jgi:hypothetical protein
MGFGWHTNKIFNPAPAEGEKIGVNHTKKYWRTNRNNNGML